MPVKRKFSRGTRSSSARKYRKITRRVTSSSRPMRKRMRNSRTFKRALSMHSYSRYATDPQDYNFTGLELDVAEALMFNKIKGYTEFSALYDRYRITAVQMQITLINNPNAFLYVNGALNTQNQTNWYPKLWYVKDYDDDTTITLAAMRERSGVKNVLMLPNKTYKIMIRPAILNQTYRTSTTTGYAPKWKEWIDMAQTDVPHYGLKWIVESQNVDPDNSQPFKIRVEYKYFFTCKDVL